MMAARWSGTCKYLDSQVGGKGSLSKAEMYPRDHESPLCWKRSHQVTSLSYNALTPFLPLEAHILEMDGVVGWMDGWMESF